MRDTCPYCVTAGEDVWASLEHDPECDRDELVVGRVGAAAEHDVIARFDKCAQAHEGKAKSAAGV